MDMETDLVVFLGVCESCLIRGDGILQDIYGVGDFLLLPYFPQNLRGIYLLVGLHKEAINKKIHLLVKDTRFPERKAWHDIDTKVKLLDRQAKVNGFTKHYEKDSSNEGLNNTQLGHPLLIPLDFTYKMIPFPCPPLLVTEPTNVEVSVTLDGKELVIGSFKCVFVQTPPISEQERKAIMSRPGAIKGFHLDLGCKNCEDKKGYYVLLDPESDVPDVFSSDTPLSNSPDEWICKCKKTTVPLIYAKKGFHNIFRSKSKRENQDILDFLPLYQKGALAAVLSQYQKVLNDYKDSEEEVQKFLETHHILWNFLAPLQIWKKPPILSKYKTDFAILNRSRILYLIEIEKPSTKLIKTNGGMHSQLQAGLDQIRDWKKKIEKHREAVLDALELAQNDVHTIKYILIAGMASKTPINGLEKIRSMRTDVDSIFCFDELASFLHSLETSLLEI